MDETPNLPGGASWAPWSQGNLDWLSARNEAAAEWIISAAVELGSPIVVQGTTYPDELRRSDGPIGRLARAGTVATYRSPASGATYLQNASIQLLATALTNADGHAVVVTEVPTFPLHGWAMAVGAANLETGQVTVDERTDEQREWIDSLAWNLYNGWSHPEVGRRATARVMPLLAESGMSYSTFVGSMLAVRPRRLTRRDDINEMNKALPVGWERQREQLANP